MTNPAWTAVMIIYGWWGGMWDLWWHTTTCIYISSLLLPYYCYNSSITVICTTTTTCSATAIVLQLQLLLLLLITTTTATATLLLQLCYYCYCCLYLPSPCHPVCPGSFWYTCGEMIARIILLVMSCSYGCPADYSITDQQQHVKQVATQGLGY